MSQAQRRVPLTELRERVPTASASDRHYTNAERRLPPRLHQSVRRVVLRPPSTAASFPSTAAQGASFSGFPNQCGESSPDRQALRRVPLTELRERVPTTSPNCPTNAASRPPTAAQGTSSHSFPNQYGEFPELSKPMRRVVPDCTNQCGESPQTATQGASFSGFPELSNQCGESSPDRQAMRRASPAFPNCPNQCGESSPDRQAMRRASPAFPNCPNLCGELFPPDCHIQCGESPHAPPNSGRESFVSPNFAANCAQNKNSSQHSPSVMRVSKYNGLRAHTHASTRRLCRPCLCFFYNFFINMAMSQQTVDK